MHEELWDWEEATRSPEPEHADQTIPPLLPQMMQAQTATAPSAGWQQLNPAALAERKPAAKLKDGKSLAAAHPPERATEAVTATAYSLEAGQTDANPHEAAWSNSIKAGQKVIAVSDDLLCDLNLSRGTKVSISGLEGEYTVADTMNKRWRKRIDILLPTAEQAREEWGIRDVTISWDPAQALAVAEAETSKRPDRRPNIKSTGPACYVKNSEPKAPKANPRKKDGKR